MNSFLLTITSVFEISTIVLSLIAPEWFAANAVNRVALCNLFKCDYYHDGFKFATEYWQQSLMTIPLCIAMSISIIKTLTFAVGKFVDIIGLISSIINSILLTIVYVAAFTLTFENEKLIEVGPVVYLITICAFINYGLLVSHSRNIIISMYKYIKEKRKNVSGTTDDNSSNGMPVYYKNV